MWWRVVGALQGAACFATGSVFFGDGRRIYLVSDGWG